MFNKKTFASLNEDDLITDKEMAILDHSKQMSDRVSSIPNDEFASDQRGGPKRFNIQVGNLAAKSETGNLSESHSDEESKTS